MQGGAGGGGVGSSGGGGGGVPGSSLPPGAKPAVGTPEWHKLRRENHKEVERRRRETINAGILELARIIPGCEKAKGSILTRAVQYIQDLREAEHANLEKWTLEKLLLEQAIDELTRELAGVRQEVERIKTERDAWRERAEELERTAAEKGISHASMISAVAAAEESRKRGRMDD